MARIAGVDLPRQKQARIALTYIYGIGQPRALKILGSANVEPGKKVQDLNEDEVNRIRQVIEGEGGVEGDLRKDISMHIKRLIEIGSYRGSRHRKNLPVRGQRTHTAQGDRGQQEEGHRQDLNLRTGIRNG
jgi:small subunit ribosomal protein S13